MAAKKVANQNKFFKARLDKINKTLVKFEGEVEKAIGGLIKRRDHSGKVLRKNLDDVLGRISTSPIYSRASEKTEEVAKEIRRLADEVVDKVKGLDFTLAQSVVSEVRESADQLVHKLQNAELVELARVNAVRTSKKVLKLLNIPSHEEILGLSRKVSGLEKKVKTLTQKAA